MYTSSNRDEPHWERAEDFDITREVSSHLGFGDGVYARVGMGLARLEGNAVLSALVNKVERLELHVPVPNSITSSARLPVSRLVIAA